MKGLALALAIFFAPVVFAQQSTPRDIVSSNSNMDFPKVNYEDFRKMHLDKRGKVEKNPVTNKPYTEAELKKQWQEILDRSPFLKQVVEFNPNTLFAVTRNLSESAMADLDILLRFLTSLTHQGSQNDVMLGGDAQSLFNEWNKLTPAQHSVAWANLNAMSEMENDFLLAMLGTRVRALTKNLSEDKKVLDALEGAGVSSPQQAKLLENIKAYIVSKQPKPEKPAQSSGAVGGGYAIMIPAISVLQQPLTPKGPTPLPTVTPATPTVTVPKANGGDDCQLFKKADLDKINIKNINFIQDVEPMIEHADRAKSLYEDISSKKAKVGFPEMTNSLQQFQMLLSGGKGAKKAKDQLDSVDSKKAQADLKDIADAAEKIEKAKPDILDKVANGLDDFNLKVSQMGLMRTVLKIDDPGVGRAMQDMDALKPALEEAAGRGVIEAKSALQQYEGFKQSFCVVKDAQDLAGESQNLQQIGSTLNANNAVIQQLNGELGQSALAQKARTIYEKAQGFTQGLAQASSVIGNVADGFSEINDISGGIQAVGNLAKVTGTYAKLPKMVEKVDKITSFVKQIEPFAKTLSSVAGELDKFASCIPNSNIDLKLRRWKSLLDAFKWDGVGAEKLAKVITGVVSTFKKIKNIVNKITKIVNIAKKVIQTIQTLQNLYQMIKMMDGLDDAMNGLTDTQVASDAITEMRATGAENSLNQVDELEAAADKLQGVEDLGRISKAAGVIGEGYEVSQSLKELESLAKQPNGTIDLQQGVALVNNLSGSLSKLPGVGNCLQRADVQSALQIGNQTAAFVNQLKTIQQTMSADPSLRNATASLQAINSSISTLPYVGSFISDPKVQSAITDIASVGNFASDLGTMRESFLNSQSMSDLVNAAQRLNAGIQNIPFIQKNLKELEEVTNALDQLRMGADLVGSFEKLTHMKKVFEQLRGLRSITNKISPLDKPINSLKQKLAGMMEKINQLNQPLCLKIFGSKEDKGWKKINVNPANKDFGLRWCITNFKLPVGPATIYGALGRVFEDNRYRNVSLKGAAAYTKSRGVDGAVKGVLAQGLSTNAAVYTNMLSNFGVTIPGINSLIDGVAGSLPAVSMSKYANLPHSTYFWNYGWLNRRIDYSALNTAELYSITHNQYRYDNADNNKRVQSTRILAYARDMLAGGIDAELTGKNQIKNGKGYYGTFSCKPLRSNICPLGKCSNAIRTMLELDSCANQYIVPFSLANTYIADNNYSQSTDANYLQPLSMVPPDDCQKNAKGECICKKDEDGQCVTISNPLDPTSKKTVNAFEYDLGYYLKRAWYGVLVLPYYPWIIDTTAHYPAPNQDRLHEILTGKSKQSCYSFLKGLRSSKRLAVDEKTEETVLNGHFSHLQLVGLGLCGFYDSDGSYITVDAFNRKISNKKVDDPDAENVVLAYGGKNNYAYVKADKPQYDFTMQVSDLAKHPVERIIDVTHPWSPRWHTLIGGDGKSITERVRYSKCTEFRLLRHKNDCGEGMEINLLGIKIPTDFIPLLYKGYGDHTGVPFDKDDKAALNINGALGNIISKSSIQCAASPVDIMTFREKPFHRCILCRIKRNEECFWKEFNDIIMMQVITKIAEEAAFTAAQKVCAAWVGDELAKVCGILVKFQMKIMNLLLTGHEDMMDHDLTSDDDGSAGVSDSDTSSGENLFNLIYNAYYAVLTNRNPYLESGALSLIIKSGALNIADQLKAAIPEANDKAQNDPEYKQKKKELRNDMAREMCGKLLQWFCRPVVSLLASNGKKADGAIAKIADQVDDMNEQGKPPLFCKGVKARHGLWPPCSTRYNEADRDPKYCAASCPVGIKQCCHDLAKSLTPINPLKMEPYRPKDNKGKDSSFFTMMNAVSNGMLTMKSVSDKYLPDGLTFEEYFGDHRPYIRRWDTGAEWGAIGMGLGQIDYSSDMGKNLRIVGVGDEKNSCRSSGWKGIQGYMKARGETSLFNIPDMEAIKDDVMNYPTSASAQAHALTGWTALKMYQARCYKYFRLNGLCMFEKTFKPYMAEDAVLQAAGAKVTVSGDDNMPLTIIWPLAFRGYVDTDAPENPSIMDERFPNFAATKINRGMIEGGMGSAMPGDIIIWDMESYQKKKTDSGELKTYPFTQYLQIKPHVAFVKASNVPVHNYEGDDMGKPPFYVDVLSYNLGRNPDACGVTDGVGASSNRRIYQSYSDMPKSQREVFAKLAKATGISETSLASCYNPDLSVCVDDMWSYAKVYRPSADYRGTGCMVRRNRNETIRVDINTLSERQLINVPSEDVRVCMDEGRDPPKMAMLKNQDSRRATLPDNQLTNLCSPGFGGIGGKDGRRKMAGVFVEQGCAAVGLSPRPLWKGTPVADVFAMLGLDKYQNKINMAVNGILGKLPCGGGMKLQEAVTSVGKRYAQEAIVNIGDNIKLGRPAGGAFTSARGKGVVSDVASAVCPGFSISGLTNTFNVIFPSNKSDQRLSGNTVTSPASSNNPKDNWTILTPDESVIYIDSNKGPAELTLPNGGEFQKKDGERVTLTGKTDIYVANGVLTVKDGAQLGLSYEVDNGTIMITPYGAMNVPSGASLPLDVTQPLIPATNTLVITPEVVAESGVIPNEFIESQESNSVIEVPGNKTVDSATNEIDANVANKNAANVFSVIEKEADAQPPCTTAGGTDNAITTAIEARVTEIKEKQDQGETLSTEEDEFLKQLQENPEALGYAEGVEKCY